MEIDRKVLSLLRDRREGLSLQGLARRLRLRPGQKAGLKKVLDSLEDRGVILKVARRYLLYPRARVVRGRLVTALRGYGFVRPEGSSGEDVFIPARYSGGACQGDLVEVLLKTPGRERKPEGRVLRIVEKGRKSLLGYYKERRGEPFFVPFDSPSPEEVPLEVLKRPPLKPGMIVQVNRDSRKVEASLGMPDDPGVDTLVVIQRFGLRSSFSAEALAEAGEISLGIPSEERKTRADYRNWLTVTIDGENAQDFDDAVSVEELPNGNFLLGVHIADVFHYVRPGSALDREARLRGTSVYFPGLTLPMLPERLSNNICSLKPRENRLAVSVLLEIDAEGKVRKRDFCPSLIRTAERMTYNSVFKIFEGDRQERDRYPAVVKPLLQMKDLASRLRKRRIEEGSLDFDLVEPELIYRDGNLHSVAALERNEAHRVIEDFMLAANEAVASFLLEREIPQIFRVHPPPAVGDLRRLGELLKCFGLFLPPAERINSKDLQRILQEAEAREEVKFIILQVLRSLRLAVYSDVNQGHFGLAKKIYTHFTSPIRRYPDLVVHRLLKKALDHEVVEDVSLSLLARHCSEQERKADEAEKDLLEWRIFRLLKTRLGDEMAGIVVDVSKAGLAVELQDYFVDGLIPYSDLMVSYLFKAAERALVRRGGGKGYDLGNKVRVVLASVDPFQRKLILALA